MISKANLLKQPGLVGVTFYEKILNNINLEKVDNKLKPLEVLDIQNLIYYLAKLDLKYIKDSTTKRIIQTMRIEPKDIKANDLVWESFVITKDMKCWRPYKLITSTLSEIIIQCHDTINITEQICYAMYDSKRPIKEIKINKNPLCEVLCLLKLPLYNLEYDDTADQLECINSICKVNKVYHGTAYTMKEAAEYAPYNYYGNWFTLGLDDNYNKGGESLAYMSDQSKQNVMTSYLYEYKLKKSTNVLYFPENNQIDYLFAHMMYFDTSIAIVDETSSKLRIKLDSSTNKPFIPTNNTTINSIIFCDTHTMRQPIDAMILKYNYTINKNLLDTSLPEPNFTKGYWSVIKSELTDDGDKGLAGILCDYNNSSYLTTSPRLKVDGWVVKNIYYLMSCDPKSILENLGVYVKIKPPLMTGNPAVGDKFDKIIDEYKKILMTDPDIIIESINFEDYIYVPKTKYDIFRNNIKKLNEDLVKNYIKYNRYYREYYDELSKNMSDPNEKTRLDTHKKIIEPNRFIIGGKYYKKYMKYKAKYLALKQLKN